MRFSEVFYDLKRADEYSEDELHRLAVRCAHKESAGKLNEHEAASEVVTEEIKDKSLVPNHEEGIKLIRSLLSFKRELKPTEPEL